MGKSAIITGPVAAGKRGWAERRLPEVYVLLALLLTGALCILTPPFGVPDEGAQARRGIEIAHRQIVTRKTAAGVGTAEDANLVSVADSMQQLLIDFTHRQAEGAPPDAAVTPLELEPLEHVHWGGPPQFTSFRNTAAYAPVLYLPEAVGWALAEAVDLTIVRSLMLARMCVALCAIALGWLALRLSGSGRWLVFAYLMLPTVLSLNASCSQDGVLLPLAALAVVLVTRALEARRALTAKELIVVATLLALCAGARVTYVPLALVMLVPAFEARERLRRPMLAILATIGVVALWELTLLDVGTLIGPEANPALQAHLMLTHPGHPMLAMLDAVFSTIPTLVMNGLYMMGWNNVGPPDWVYNLMLLGLTGVGLTNASITVSRWRSRALLLVAIAGVLVGTSLAEYLIWTAPGATRVAGLQSRYFLPLVPLTMMLASPLIAWLRKRLFAARGHLRERLLLGSACACCASACAIPMVAARVFYLMSVGDALRVALR